MTLDDPSVTEMAFPSDLARFSAALDLYPAAFAGNRLNLLFLEDAERIAWPRQYLRQLDSPSLMEERREYVLDPASVWPFPVFRVRERPDPWALSDRLFARFDDACRVVPTQAEFAGLLEQTVRERRPDIVALVIADGLSYYDLPDDTNAEPLLVDGVSTTGFGYRRVAGNPPISRRLFAMGYKVQLGYTYFPPEPGSLADDILATFSRSQVVKVKAFDEVLKHLRRRRLERAYVQVSTEGLDQICHAHRDRPPREHYLEEILARYERLIDCLVRGGRRVLACLVADHGILWREAIEGHEVIVGDLLPEDARSPRYIRGRLLREYARCVTSLGHNYTVLRAPYLTRKLRTNEWGVHGGISAWESIVPLFMRAV
jgi:hypothetical protein